MSAKWGWMPAKYDRRRKDDYYRADYRRDRYRDDHHRDRCRRY
jgi:hypothetical protein